MSGPQSPPPSVDAGYTTTEFWRTSFVPLMPLGVVVASLAGANFDPAGLQAIAPAAAVLASAIAQSFYGWFRVTVKGAASAGSATQSQTALATRTLNSALGGWSTLPPTSESMKSPVPKPSSTEHDQDLARSPSSYEISIRKSGDVRHCQPDKVRLIPVRRIIGVCIRQISTLASQSGVFESRIIFLDSSHKTLAGFLAPRVCDSNSL
jgi:hypothetical protein